MSHIVPKGNAKTFQTNRCMLESSENKEKIADLLQGLSVPFACVGSGDPVRVLRLYTTNTLDVL